MSEKLKIVSYGALSNRGERDVNEDYLGSLCFHGHFYFVLCDGLGGHGNGDVASHFVVDQVLGCLQQGRSIEESIMYAQNGLLAKQREEQAEATMKTTVTCLELSGQSCRFAHVGDSRIYVFEKNKYRYHSKDHSVPQMLVDRGEITEREIRHHEDRSRLLRVMGTEWDYPKYEVTDSVAVSNHTTFLLCSDGFWELIEEKKMAKTLKRADSPEEWLHAMEKIIRENGKGTNMDNYSAIAVFIR